jgi:hypothetical protein
MDGHHLYLLFLALEKAAPNAAASVIDEHRYARGERNDFIETIKQERWCSKTGATLTKRIFWSQRLTQFFFLADAFRDTVREIHPDRRSAFDVRAEQGAP